MEEETFEVSESFEETQKRIEDENKAAEQAEKRAARERAKSRRAEAARRSVGFQDQEDSTHDITFNDGAGDTPPRNAAMPRSVLKRKDRGSSDKTQKILKTSEMFPPSDWPLGMSREQVRNFSKN